VKSLVVLRAVCIALCLWSLAATRSSAGEPSLADTDTWLQYHLPTDAHTCNVCVGPVISTWDEAAYYRASDCTLSIDTSASLGSIEPPSDPIYRPRSCSSNGPNIAYCLSLGRGPTHNHACFCKGQLF
jgi:hypothetical protein